MEVIARSFYADKDTLTPLFAALGGALINFVFALILSDVQTVDVHTSLNILIRSVPVTGHIPEIGNVSGLALANSLGVMFEVLSLLYILRKRWDGIQENILAQTVIKTLFASLVMAGVIIVVDTLWRTIGLGDSFIMTIARLAVEGVIGLITFIIVAIALKMRELSELWLIIRRRTA